MQFVVPQFIEVESKVIGPISVRQFIILLGTAGIMFIWYSLFSFIPFVILSVITFAIGGTFAFVRINSQPFHEFALSAVQTGKRPGLSLWRHEINQAVIVKVARKDKRDLRKKKDELYLKPEVSNEHIAELSLIADTRGKYNSQNIELLRQAQAAQKLDTKPKLPNKDQ